MAKIDRQGQNQKDVAHIKANGPLNLPDNITKQKIQQTNDIISALNVKINQETDPAKKQQLQDMLGNAQETQKNYTNVIRGGKGDAPDVMKEKTGAALNSLSQPGVTPETLPMDQKTALQSSGNNPLRPETTASIENAKYATKGMDEEIKSHDQLAKSSADMTAKSNQILQVIAADPNLRSGFGTEALTSAQAALHNYLPNLIPSNNFQQLFQKLGKQLLVDASGIMRGEAGSGFRLTQGEILNIVSKTVPDIANNSVEGIKYIIEASNAMNSVYSQMSGAAKAIRDNPNLSQAQKSQAMNQLQQAGLKDMETQGLNFVNSRLAPTGQKIMINPDYDPVKHPVDKYLRVGADGQTSSFGHDNSPPESNEQQQDANSSMPVKDTSLSQTPNQPQSPNQSPMNGVSPTQQGNPMSPLPDMSQSQVTNQQPTQQYPHSAPPPIQDTTQQIKPDVAPPQNVYSAPPDPSQSMLAPQSSSASSPQPQMDQQQMLAMALANKQQNTQLPDYSSQFSNSPNMSMSF